MKFKFTLILMVLILFLSMNFIVAEDVNQTDNFEMSVDESVSLSSDVDKTDNLEMSVDESVSLSSDVDENTLKQDVASNSADVIGDDGDGMNHVFVSPSGSGSNGSQDNPGDFKETLTNIADNTVVHMLDGDYTFNVTDNSIGIKLENKNNIKIIAQNPGSVTLKSNSNNSNCQEFYLYATNILFKDINFYSSTLSKNLFYFTAVLGGSTVYSHSFENCKFIGFKQIQSMMYGESFSANYTLLNCSFINNTAAGTQNNVAMIYLMGINGRILLENSSFINNNASFTNGLIQASSNLGVLIKNCSFSNNTAFSISASGVLSGKYIIYLTGGGRDEIEICTFENNAVASSISIKNSAAKYYKAITGCKFYNFTPLQGSGTPANILITQAKKDSVCNISSCYFEDDNDDFQISLKSVNEFNLILENNTVKSKKILNVESVSSLKKCMIYDIYVNILNSAPVVVAGGQTSKIQYNLTLTDDMGNLINNKYGSTYFDLIFDIEDGQKCTAKYNAADGLYSFDYAAPEVNKTEHLQIDRISISKFSDDLVFDQLDITVKPPVNMSMDDVIDSVYGENVTVNVNISNIESGSLIYEFIKNNEVIKTVTDSFKNNVSTVTVNDLPAGDYTVNVKCEDSNYAPTTVSKSFTVNKANSTVKIDMDSVITVFDNITVQAIVPANATGNVTFRLNNNKTVNVTDDIAEVIFEGLTAGNYTIYAVYNGDDNYNPSEEANFTFSVVKLDSVLEVTHSEPVVGEDVTITIIMNEDVNDYVAVIINDKPQSELLINGTATVTIPSVSASEVYSVKVEYAGSEKYLAKSNSTSFAIFKLDTDVELSLSDIAIGEDVVVKIKLAEDINDNVTVNVDGVGDSIKLTDGYVEYTISNVTAGTHTIIVNFNGNDKYNAAFNSTSFAVFKLDTDVELSLSDIAIGEDVVVKVKLAGDINDNVTVNVDGVSDSIKLTNGYVEYTISNVTAGGHTIIVNFNGNDKYNAAFNSTSFTVDKLNPAVVAGADPIYVGDDAVITITVDSKATGSVLVGNNYYAVINDGSAKVTIPNLANGTYTYSVVYSGDEKYNKSETTVSVVVNKKATVSKVNVDDIELGQVAEITVSGLPSDATGKITIEVTGVPAQTINVGQTCSIPDLTNGTYTVNIIYSGDDRYAGSTDSKVFTVKYVEPVNETSITNITDLNTDTKDISISLPGDASGTLSVTVDGNTTTVGVVNGTANVPVNLTAGKHDVKVSYSGDGKYAGFTKESSVDVAKAAPGVVPSVPASIVAGSSISLPINLPADATGVVLVDVAGQKYYGEVTKGVANVAIAGLTAGDKTLTYNYLGDAKYAPVNGSVILKVTNPAPTPKPKADVIKLTLKKVKVKKSAKKLVISATLKINGKAVKGKKITFKFNKKTFTAKTNKKGVAKITVKKAVLKNLKVGKKVTYTAKYSKNTVKKTVKVKK